MPFNVLPAALNLLLWMAGYTPIQRNELFFALPEQSQTNFIEHNQELWTQQMQAIEEQKCVDFADTMAYVSTQLKIGGKPWDDEQWQFMRAVGEGAQKVNEGCIGGSSQDLPAFINRHTYVNRLPMNDVPAPFRTYLIKKRYSVEQTMEIFQSFTEETQKCLRERLALPAEHYVLVPWEFRFCHVKRWNPFAMDLKEGDVAERQFIREILGETV